MRSPLFFGTGRKLRKAIRSSRLRLNLDGITMVLVPRGRGNGFHPFAPASSVCKIQIHSSDKVGQSMCLVRSFLVVSALALSSQIASTQNVDPPKTLDEAMGAEFKCPSGTHDSGAGPSPGVVVRWCDVERNGRPVYHGPVWRWYPSGKLDGKEYYVNGDAAGVWPSYYENGHMSSLGAWDGGTKRGLWKYWDGSGWLKTEVTYSKEGNSRTDYYPSGRKKAVGVFTRSGKVGKWTYWTQNGKEKAHCDFGRGAFTISDGGCKMIADELDPKGYSPPIPVGTKADDGSVSVRIDSQTFKFTSPQEWTADVNAGSEEDAPLVFYPKGRKWRTAGANMYVRVCYKNGRSFEAVTKDSRDDFEQTVADYQEHSSKKGRLSGRDYRLDAITYKPVIETDSPFSIVASNRVHEQVAYLDGSDEVVLLLVLTANSDQQLDQSLPAFRALLESFH